SLVVLGLMSVYQLAMVQEGIFIPDVVTWLSTASFFEFLPARLDVFVPLAALIVIGLRRSGYARLLFAVGDNAIAARLSGTPVWQGLLVLCVVSAGLAGVGGR